MRDSVATTYKDGTYAAANPGCGEENAAWKAGQVLRMIQKGGINPLTVCEVGCGSGGILSHLHGKMPPSVCFTGVEPMPEAFEKCSARSGERLTFIHDTAAGLSETFDLVLLLDVFEHVEDYMGFLRSLRPLGRQFIFHIPLDMTTQMVMRDKPIMRVRQGVGHLHYFNKNTALATLQDTGYEVQDWFYSDITNAASSSLRFKLMKLPRRILMKIAPDFAVRLLGGNPLTVLARPAA